MSGLNDVQLMVLKGITVLPQPPPVQTMPADESAVTKMVVAAALLRVNTLMVVLPAGVALAAEEPALAMPVTGTGLGLTLVFSTLKVTELMAPAVAEPIRMVIWRGEPVGSNVMTACAEPPYKPMASNPKTRAPKRSFAHGQKPRRRKWMLVIA